MSYLCAVLFVGCSSRGLRAPGDCSTRDTFFAEAVEGPILLAQCAACHTSTGAARGTRLVLSDDSSANLRAFASVGDLVLQKPTGRTAHSGGNVLAGDADKIRALEDMVATLQQCAAEAPPSAEAPLLGADGRYVCTDRVYASPSQMRRLSWTQYRNTVRAIFGDAVAPSDAYPGATGASITGYSTEPELLTLGIVGAEQLMTAAEDVAISVVGALPALLSCAGGAECAATFVDTYAARAYRRPLTAEERARLLDLYGGDFEESIAAITAAMMQMPSVVYRIEEGSGRALTPVELASRLSFALWDGPPDTLPSGAFDVNAEARRMLADERSAPVTARFFREWTRFEGVETDKDATIYPGYSPDADLAALDAFSRGLVADGTVQDILTRAPGLMGQPAVMAALAHSTDSSYVLRGKFVLQRVLCEALGSPPANAQNEFAALDFPAQPTAADKSNAVRSVAACAGCHEVIDPLGLAFEHFDGAGAWRETYASGKPIDADHAALQAELAVDPRFTACVAKQWFRYVAGRMETDADACAIQDMGDAGDRLDAMMTSLLSSASFTHLPPEAP